MRKCTIYRSKRSEYSLIHFNIRSKIDACLYDDIENYFAKHNLSSYIVIDKILNHDFLHARFTDHEYPI